MKVTVTNTMLLLAVLSVVAAASPPRTDPPNEILSPGERVGETLYWNDQNALSLVDTKQNFNPPIETVPEIVAPDTFLTLRPSQSMISKLKTIVHWPGSDWRTATSWKNMERMIKYRPTYVNLGDPLALIAENAPKIFHASVVALPKGSEGGKLLSHMSLKGQTFYVEDSLGYVWMFNRRPDGKYTYTTSLNDDTTNVIKEVLRRAKNSMVGRSLK